MRFVSELDAADLPIYILPHVPLNYKELATMRIEGRNPADLRPVTIELDINKFAEGSALIRAGDTHVLCTVTEEHRVPRHVTMQGGGGWVTAEYGLLPRSTPERTVREAVRGRQQGRTQEIQRLIGRALRAVVNMDVLGERTFWVDCDVIQADGGTRCAAITGAFAALYSAIRKLYLAGHIKTWPITRSVAAVSVGLVSGEIVLDLSYKEDFVADVDMNVVQTSMGGLVEVQGTAEKETFDRDELNQLLDLAGQGLRKLFRLQADVLGISFSNSGEIDVAASLGNAQRR